MIAPTSPRTVEVDVVEEDRTDEPERPEPGRPEPGRGTGRHRRAEEDHAPAGSEQADEDTAPPEPRTPLTQQVGRVVVAVAAVLFGVFAVVNSQRVSFDWILGETTATFTDGGDHVGGGVPLIVLLVSSFVTGIAVGWFATWRRRRHR